MNTKACSKCGEVKVLSDFHRSSSSRDGRAPRCKKCRNDESRSYAERRRRAEADAEARAASLRASGDLKELG